MNSYYSKLTLVTVIAVYLLILAGGIVRSTGSGMGCPDWPKCFGQYIPPTDESQLPADYQDFYSEYRYQKNLKFVKYLTFFGYDELGERILNDPKIKEEEKFNAAKTWTEYINRLLGAIVGFFILLSFLFSWKFRKSDYRIPLLATSSLLLVLFQAWIGSVVVSTNLLSGLITIHMVLALIIIGLLIGLNHRAQLLTRESKNKIDFNSKRIALFIVGSLFLMIIQIILGTDVRESVDLVSDNMGNDKRGYWIENLGLNFYIHRSFSIVIFLWNLYLWYVVIKIKNVPKRIKRLANILIVLFFIIILSGIIMAYFAIPFWVQPIHLVLGSLIIGCLVQLYLSLQSIKKRKSEESYVYT